jgi:signal peptidase II
MKISKLKLGILVVISILVADQALKFWIKTTFALGDEIVIFKNWFILHFVENNGMAFGIEFAGKWGKLFLSVFRILAICGIGWYITSVSRKDVPRGFIVSLSMIFAGAIGNIIDSAFYGVVFNHSYGQVASLFPEGGGYASFLHGRVVDMLYFPLIEGYYPGWFPFVGGNDFVFFRPVFNLADSSITVGITLILLFYRKHFNSTEPEKPVEETAPAENPEISEEPLAE